MNFEKHKKITIEAFKVMKEYCYLVTEGLTEDQINWKPDDTRARSIISYFRHMVNTEIYWINAIESSGLTYMQKETSFNEMIESFKKLETHYLKLLENSSEEDFDIKATKYDKEENLIEKGSLYWTVLRVILHNFGHIHHFSYIRYGIENPHQGGGKLWWKLTELIIKLTELN